MTSDHTWHRTLLSALAARMKPRCFIELGLGPEQAAIGWVSEHCYRAYGVDIEPHPHAYPNARIFQMATEDFFAGPAQHIEPPDLVFIDADHHSAQVRRDLANVEAICAPNCLVVIHDTFPENSAYATEGYCCDSHVVPSYLTCENVTLPFPPGLTLCRLKPQSQI